MGVQKRAKELLRHVRQNGRSPTVDGVYVTVDKNGRVTFDQDGQPVAPNDPTWNGDDQIAARLNQRKEGPKS